MDAALVVCLAAMALHASVLRMETLGRRVGHVAIAYAVIAILEVVIANATILEPHLLRL